MENASKALIIAGAILISILLISVGVLIMNSMDPMKDAAGKQADSMAIRTFNSQFTAYEGIDVPASQVRALFSTVAASNASYKGEHEVTITEGTGYISSSTSVNSNDKYSVILDYENGYVKTVTIEKFALK